MQGFFIDKDISKAKTLDTAYYTSPQHYEASKEKIFAPSWQFIGTTDSVSGAGCAAPITLLDGYLDEPLLLTKDKDGTLHCMSNVCTHRGNLLVSAPCRLDHLRCKYHGRLFSLDGKFVSMPEFKEVKDLPLARVCSIALCVADSCLNNLAGLQPAFLNPVGANIFVSKMPCYFTRCAACL